MSAPSVPPSRRLVYLANIRLPSERAHVLQIFKNCEAFARQGVSVQLVHPGRRTTEAEGGAIDGFEYYAVEKCFEIKELRIADLIGLGLPGVLDQAAFVLHSSLFFLASLRLGLASPLVYTRDLVVATFLALMDRPFALELHTLPEGLVARFWLRFVARRAVAIVLISKHLEEDYRRTGASHDVVLVAPDAVDRNLLVNPPEDRTLARKREGLPLDARIAAYAGHLYEWKGLDTVLDCAREMPDVLFLIVGGFPQDVDRLADKCRTLRIENVRLEGYVAPSRVPGYLAAADVLLLPNSGRSAISARHTSPLKAFEYMASERPIVGSDLPSIREILEDGRHALLVPPDDPGALARGIRRLFDDPELGRFLAENARARVRSCTWDARAKAILDFIASRGALAPAREPCCETA